MFHPTMGFPAEPAENRPAWIASVLSKCSPGGGGYREGKRALDFFSAAILLVVTLPLIVAIWLAGLACGTRPMLLREAHHGQNSREFLRLRFPAPTGRGSVLGRVIRRTKFDGLPQLVNILRGEMSFIGPRAIPVDLAVGGTPYEEVLPEFRDCLVMRPGVLGLSQLSIQDPIATARDARASFQLDMDYITHATFRLDCLILLQAAKQETLRNGKRTRRG